MDYLCAAVKKEVVTRETFYSREEAVDYFQQKFEGRIVEKMEENVRRLEHRILSLERRMKRCEKDSEMMQNLSERMQAAEGERRAIERWLNGEDDQRAVYMEENSEPYRKQLITEDEVVFFRMCGIYHHGRSYTVTEEKYSYMCRVVTDIEGSLEAMMQLPEKMTKKSSSFYIREYIPETAKKYIMRITGTGMRIRRDYHKNSALMKNTGIFTGL